MARTAHSRQVWDVYSPFTILILLTYLMNLIWCFCIRITQLEAMEALHWVDSCTVIALILLFGYVVFICFFNIYIISETVGVL